ncbi:hypothetical protein CRUP_006677 [Coryphaenoides rupestris]|nr:hypothetical protein CRUP_006677 [Coryphaenoides rupestris]
MEITKNRRIPSVYSHGGGGGGMMMMKKQINLNLSAQDDAELLSKSDGILGSPDLGLLKLASPDLERLIIQSNGMVAAAAPTPTLATTPAATSHFLYPKSASDEQEFAEGFVKALEGPPQAEPAQRGGGGGVLRLDLQASDLPVYTTLNGYAASPLGTSINYSAADTVPFPAPPPPHMPGVQQQHQQTAAALSRLQSAGLVKDEPQTVPDMQSFGESPPSTPIDMDNQERIKAERKKLRNRIAASKCRKRKLERISRLEDKVKSLKTQNTELASTASVLREQVAQLKQKVMNHVSNGCQLHPNQVQAY